MSLANSNFFEKSGGSVKRSAVRERSSKESRLGRRSHNPCAFRVLRTFYIILHLSCFSSVGPLGCIAAKTQRGDVGRVCV